ncbi:hypothetical protein KI387_017041 [Taxus chinensis]|uniref:Uncharacterized protein n=1 Tax=Taxus chinensis TaxID=29808 RepID=A0AA38LIP1_TAXCH|nr:hypothetical protein KI387_017041 [Taxus chinensis]
MASTDAHIISMLPATSRRIPFPIRPHKTPRKFHLTHLTIKLKLQTNSILLQKYYTHIPFSSLSSSSGRTTIRAYIEKPNPVKDFAEKIIGSLPIVGLLYRLINAEGGVGGDRIQLPEFCKRVENKCTQQDSRAFYDFKERHGKTGNPRFVLLWCWVAAIGAGLVKSEDILLGAVRLRVSFDMQYEEENFNILMDEATSKRAKSKTPLPEIPMEARAEKALEAICKCCLGNNVIKEEEDARLLSTMLCAVFTTADKAEIEKSVWSRLKPSSIDNEISQETEAQQKKPIVVEQDTETVYI